MDDKKILKKINKILIKNHCRQPSVKIKNSIVYLKGSVSSYDDFIKIGTNIGKLTGVQGVVNNIVYPGYKQKKSKPTGRKNDLGKADVVIIGGGVVGSAIARELSRYELTVILVEKKNDVAAGTTKANNALVHTGIGENMGTLKQKLCVKGHHLFKKLAEELCVPYKETGMWIVLSKDSLSQIPLPFFIRDFISRYIVPRVVLKRGKQLGIPLYLVKRKKLFQMEPNITRKALVAIFSPTYAVTSPYIFTIALAENAVENGVKLLLNTEVVDITTENNKVTSVVTTKGVIHTDFVINAAGVSADEIAEMADAREYTIHPKKGATVIFDKETKGYITHSMSLLQLPKKAHYKGGGVMYTFEGNIQWGPTIAECSKKDDVTVTKAELDEIFERYSLLVPEFPISKVISFFTGVRACTFTEDFIIRPAYTVKGFIHVAGIQSPGLTAAPAIANMVKEILENEGLSLTLKNNFNPHRKCPPVLRDLPLAEQEKLIKENPLYGNIICRCEQVSEGEIVNAIHSTIPATTIDAIKRRTRAGMGRCQGGFCLPLVAKILARETGTPLELVTKKGDGSNLFVGRAKSLLEQKHDEH